MSDETISLDIESLTMAEAEELEERSGKMLNEIFAGEVTAKVLRALAFIAKRRDDPSITWEQVGALRLSAVEQPKNGDGGDS